MIFFKQFAYITNLWDEFLFQRDWMLINPLYIRISKIKVERVIFISELLLWKNYLIQEKLFFVSWKFFFNLLELSLILFLNKRIHIYYTRNLYINRNQLFRINKHPYLKYSRLINQFIDRQYRPVAIHDLIFFDLKHLFNQTGWLGSVRWTFLGSPNLLLLL